jgi:hypothetical protein
MLAPYMQFARLMSEFLDWCSLTYGLYSKISSRLSAETELCRTAYLGN